MRHSTIATTMAYYANIDDAVEEAVLGPRCNSSRNTRSAGGGDGAPEAARDVATEPLSPAAGFDQ
jgi:hypothetical protein